MQEDSWVFAIDVDDMVDGQMKPISLDGQKIVLIRLEDEFYSISNKCPHMGCPLSKGTLKNDVIKCPCHDWQFNIKTGQFIAAKEITVTKYSTKVSDNKVFVNLEGGN